MKIPLPKIGFLDPDSTKSGKREVANALLGLWMLIVFYLFVIRAPIDMQNYKDIFATITYPIMAFAGGAYGFDAWLKNKPDSKEPSS